MGGISFHFESLQRKRGQLERQLAESHKIIANLQEQLPNIQSDWRVTSISDDSTSQKVERSLSLENVRLRKVLLQLRKELVEQLHSMEGVSNVTPKQTKSTYQIEFPGRTSAEPRGSYQTLKNSSECPTSINDQKLDICLINKLKKQHSVANSKTCLSRCICILKCF